MSDLSQMVEFLSDETISGQIVFGTKHENQNLVFYKSIPHRQVVGIYRKSYLARLKRNLLKTVDDYSITDYNPEAIHVMPISAIPNVEMVTKDPDNERMDKKLIRRTKFTAFHFQNDDLKEMIILREYEHSPFLSKKRFDIVSFTRDMLTFAKKDQMILSKRVDCVIFDNKVFIFRKNGFERIFDFKKLYEKDRKKLFEFFRQNDSYTIENLDQLENECTDMPALRNISNIFHANEYRNVDLSKLKKYSESNPDLNITVNTANQSVNFGNLQKMYKFYNEAYLDNSFTGHKFEVYFKKRRR